MIKHENIYCNQKRKGYGRYSLANLLRHFQWFRYIYNFADESWEEDEKDDNEKEREEIVIPDDEGNKKFHFKYIGAKVICKIFYNLLLLYIL